jgi:hypothetical protein
VELKKTNSPLGKVLFWELNIQTGVATFGLKQPGNLDFNNMKSHFCQMTIFKYVVVNWVLGFLAVFN